MSEQQKPVPGDAGGALARARKYLVALSVPYSRPEAETERQAIIAELETALATHAAPAPSDGADHIGGVWMPGPDEPEAGVPAGMVLVPIEPTEAMIEAGAEAWTPGIAGNGIRTSWSAMLAAPPKQATPTDEAAVRELIEAVRVVLCESNIVEEDLPNFKAAIERLDAAYTAARSAPGSGVGSSDA